MADDVDDHAQQLQADDAEQQENETEDDGPDAIGAEPPGQGQEASHEFPGGIALVVGVLVRGAGRFQNGQNDKLDGGNRIKNKS